MPTFVDTRVELYPSEQWADYLAVMRARYDWEEVLARYDVNALLLARGNDRILLQAVQRSSMWTAVYEDEYDVLFRRNVR